MGSPSNPTGAGVPLAPRRGQVDSREQQGQLGHRQLDPGRTGRARGMGLGIELLEGPDLQPLDVGITMPSFLVRSTIFARSG